MTKLASHAIVIGSGIGLGLIVNSIAKPKSKIIYPLMGLALAYGIAFYADMHAWNKALKM